MKGRRLLGEVGLIRSGICRASLRWLLAGIAGLYSCITQQSYRKFKYAQNFFRFFPLFPARFRKKGRNFACV